MIAFNNAVVFTGEQFIPDHAVLIENGLITDVVHSKDIPADADVHNINGKILAPAFLDLQIYGGNGKLFSYELNNESLIATDDYCAKGGCTRFLITMATNSLEKMLKGIEVVKSFQQTHQSGLLGLHLEGPYINAEKRGAHLKQYIHQPSVDEVQLLLDKADGVLKMMTVAPEQCSDEVLQLLADNGVVLSAGHTNATYQQATESFNKTITAATHLFNAMSPLQSRAPGVVGAVYDHTTVNSSVVCDGIHTDFAAISISKKIMHERLFLITDAVPEIQSGEYQHLFQGDRFVLPDGTLSGSALTMIKAVTNCIDKVGIDAAEAMRMASGYPARVIQKQNRFGKIEKGFKADLLVLSNGYQVEKVMRDGRFIFYS
ncbi:MAG: N-acetylglucosamine-6-phosphate deacetylase [Lacibacter sp.]